ncbi:hypothetical protein KDA_41720 [Dictyobacter alpinus]|uniref:Uncharacterized protein n=1 Tax=Dictyobacter alpinus TaxID=2014873 RepID=A0A402BB82_9CHLR|nr:hypothetical protein [Dictyobacter alpinus]GCE28688.1 hypothetical protein KDA_41720 [Dictyobacter alpinus]
MQNVSPFNFIEDDDFDEDDEFADVDRVFSQLEQFNPPADMVARIMGAVSKLPSPRQLQEMQVVSSFGDEEGIIVRYPGREPS